MALVSGLARQIEQVDRAQGEIVLDGTEKSQVEETLNLVAVDADGSPVANVRVEPAETLAVVPVEQPPGRKEVAVRPDLVGEPALGYRLSSLRVEPSSVILQGSADVIEAAPGSVQTSPFSLEGATTDFDRPVELLLPEGATTVDGRNTVVVSATITAVEGGKTITQTPIFEGLAPEFEANAALDEVQVIISGPVPLLDSLEADDMFVILDLEGLTPGIHNVRPRVVLPTGVSQDGVIPETVEVSITPRPTPAPEPNATPIDVGGADEDSSATGTPATDSGP
jgi:YbbR domain-containing protein